MKCGNCNNELNAKQKKFCCIKCAREYNIKNWGPMLKPAKQKPVKRWSKTKFKKALPPWMKD